MNTGIDAIIEVGNLNVSVDPLPQVFRYLVEFDQDQINDVIQSWKWDSFYKYFKGICS